MTTEEARAKLDAVNSELGEFFDAVQIHATWQEEGSRDTLSVHRGIGNWHARRSISQEFIETDQQEGQANSIASKLNPPDDSESWKT